MAIGTGEPHPTLATLAPDLYKCPSVTRNPPYSTFGWGPGFFTQIGLERCSSWARKFEVLVSAIKVSLNFFFSSKLRKRRMFWWWHDQNCSPRPGSPSDICQVQLSWESRRGECRVPGYSLPWLITHCPTQNYSPTSIGSAPKGLHYTVKIILENRQAIHN